MSDNTRQILSKAATIAIIIVVVLVFVSSSYGYLNFFAVVHGYSMEPVFHNNGLTLSIPYQIAGRFLKPKVGDIIVFRAPAIPRVWCHRVYGIEADGYRTKGDNNLLPDPFTVPESDILGIVPTIGGYPLAIPGIGGAVAAFNDNFNLRLGLIGVCVIALAVMEFREKKVKRKPKKPARYKRYLILAGVGVAVFMTMFVPSLLKTGYASVGYQVAAGPGMTTGGGGEIDFGIVEVGTSQTQEITFQNGGLFPVVGVFHVRNDPLGEVSISPSPLILAGNSQDTVSVTVHAKEIHRAQPVTLAMTLVPHLLPAGWIDSLSEKNPWLPGIIISVIPAVLFPIFFGFILGPVRFRRRRVEKEKSKFPWKEALIPLVVMIAAGSIIALAYQQISMPTSFGIGIADEASGSVAWQAKTIEIARDRPYEEQLFTITNNLGENIHVIVTLIRNDGNILTSGWGPPQKELPPASPTGTWRGVLDARGLSPGNYTLVFQVRASAGGSFQTEFNVTVPVSVK